MKKVIGIVWDTDGKDVDLPEEVVLPNELENATVEEIEAWLSDRFEYLVESWDEIAEVSAKTWVIYKALGSLKITPLENYNISPQNARKVLDCSAFNTPQEVIDYFRKYCGAENDEFIVKC